MSPSQAARRVVPIQRKSSKAARRQQIINATIATLAKRGLAQTTLTEVAAAAGISHGLVIFHFQSKDNLLAETLNFMSEEYRGNWQRAFDAAADDPASKIDALLRADFEPAICEPQKLVAWCAFWGEAQSRPFYYERNGGNDAAYIALLEQLCRELIADGGYQLDATRAARVLRTTSEGTWLDLMSVRPAYNREEALRTVHFAAAALFPRHFSQSGRLPN